MTPPHLYPLCEDCDATICPPAAGFSCEHVCGASRVASEAPCGRASLNFPGASASGFFRSARFRSTQFFRARASAKTRSVAKLRRVHVSRVFSSSFPMPHMSMENHINASAARG